MEMNRTTLTNQLSYVASNQNIYDYDIRINSSEKFPVSNFKFKGFGFSFAKSLKSTDSFGISLKVPVTANFPKYDSQRYLPRLGIYIDK